MPTIKPPLTFPLTRPWTIEPSSHLVMIFSQFFFCSALSNDRMGFPSRSSSFSRKISISSPIWRSPRSENSDAEMRPSDLPPISTTTSTWRISVIAPLIIDPSLSLSKVVWARSSSIIELMVLGVSKSEIASENPRFPD